MTHIVITETETEITVHMQEPLENATHYGLATFPVNTSFTRRMAATVAAEYSNQNSMPINHAGLSLSMRTHLKNVEAQRDLVVTYRMNLGEKIA